MWQRLIRGLMFDCDWVVSPAELMIIHKADFEQQKWILHAASPPLVWMQISVEQE